MASTLTPSGWTVEPDVVDERDPLPRLTGAQITALNARIAAGSNEFPTATAIIRSDDEVVFLKQGTGLSARFEAAGNDATALKKTEAAATDGATKIGTPTGTVQDDLDARITKTGDDFLQDGASAIGAPVLLKLKERVTPLDFMTTAMKSDVRGGAPVLDHTLSIQNMLNSGEKTMDFLRWQYNVDWGNSGHLATFTGRDDITLIGRGALLKNLHSFTLDNIAAVFAASNCKRLTIKGLNFEGVPIADKSNPTTGIGYRGASFLYLTNACEDVEVEAALKYLRYGVVAGSYSNGALGNNKNINQKLRAFECGYPVAHYLSENVGLDIVALSSHRASYLAGVKGIHGQVLCKDQYIAPIQVLISDALVSAGVSRGSSDVALKVRDIGSTIFIPNSYLCAISLSRVDPGTVYENIKIESTLTGTDTIATTMSPFALYSAVNAALPGVYPFDWEPTIYMKSIDVTVNCDRSAQTVAGPTVGGDFYINTIASGAHFATVSDFRLRANMRTGSGGNPRSLYCVVPGLTDGVRVEDSNFTGYAMEYLSNTTAPITFVNCVGMSATSSFAGETSQYRFINTDTSSSAQPTANATFVQSKVANAGVITKTVIRDITLTGPSVTSANFIPAGSLIRGVSGRLKTAITGASGFQVGVTGGLTRYADLSLTAVDSTFDSRNMLQAEVDNGPRYTNVGTGLIVTAKTSDFTGGVLRIAVTYDVMGVPS